MKKAVFFHSWSVWSSYVLRKSMGSPYRGANLYFSRDTFLYDGRKGCVINPNGLRKDFYFSTLPTDMIL